LDEPFAGLDPVNLEILQDAVLSLRELGTTVIFSTHDMHVAERMCDTVFMIFQGRKVLDGTLDSIQTNYPTNQIRVRLAPGSQMPDRLPGVESMEQTGPFWKLRVADAQRPQNLLGALIESVSVDHFEVVRPTLHDIFVDIAKPDLNAIQ
jgi:ABC-2 type transport system ATP-binding protein